ncbi:unnamed protein product [Amoebophrya sp. A25]|nr:unnamed protein product [Amoebophrya sp. A25]|eukprot:GSA25T00004524001.1
MKLGFTATSGFEVHGFEGARNLQNLISHKISMKIDDSGIHDEHKYLVQPVEIVLLVSSENDLHSKKEIILLNPTVSRELIRLTDLASKRQIFHVDEVRPPKNIAFLGRCRTRDAQNTQSKLAC